VLQEVVEQMNNEEYKYQLNNPAGSLGAIESDQVYNYQQEMSKTEYYKNFVNSGCF
jgi:hypothetical protein